MSSPLVGLRPPLVSPVKRQSRSPGTRGAERCALSSPLVGLRPPLVSPVKRQSRSPGTRGAERCALSSPLVGLRLPLVSPVSRPHCRYAARNHRPSTACRTPDSKARHGPACGHVAQRKMRREKPPLAAISTVWKLYSRHLTASARAGSWRC